MDRYLYGEKDYFVTLKLDEDNYDTITTIPQ